MTEKNEDMVAPTPDPERRHVSGHRLIKLIRRNLEEQGLGDKVVPDLLGVTPVYWTSLANGTRRLSGLPREKMKRLADWLGISVIQAFLLADAFHLEDLFSSTTLDEDLFAVRAKMQADPSFAAFAPADDVWEKTDRSVRIAFALLYEKATGQRLINRALLEEGKQPVTMGLIEF